MTVLYALLAGIYALDAAFDLFCIYAAVRYHRGHDGWAEDLGWAVFDLTIAGLVIGLILAGRSDIAFVPVLVSLVSRFAAPQRPEAFVRIAASRRAARAAKQDVDA